MSKYITATVATKTTADTEALAERLGRALHGGETIELLSDLGGGKTTFVRGLARGVGSDDTVASPTFTISRLYAAGPKAIHHFDFYRLSEPGLMRLQLQEVLHDPEAIVVVEWGEIVHDVLPEQRLRVTFELAETGRILHFHVPAQLAYLIEAVK
ncbi:MAG TPA: tRNA (adenosine(37)-N6)-threonylcarbamoyltransferase complex ATPase subunit type 1 TsaE [Candidatus Saccharimonadales bacterium]|nr:tRNA (adenosine(37)-N6)-threonylcarbamoyltransferase complex ATPase subunit type 1 TsaE [Candidatus Saccharimonadales bacterium]